MTAGWPCFLAGDKGVAVESWHGVVFMKLSHAWWITSRQNDEEWFATMKKLLSKAMAEDTNDTCMLKIFSWSWSIHLAECLPREHRRLWWWVDCIASKLQWNLCDARVVGGAMAGQIKGVLVLGCMPSTFHDSWQWWREARQRVEDWFDAARRDHSHLTQPVMTGQSPATYSTAHRKEFYWSRPWSPCRWFVMRLSRGAGNHKAEYFSSRNTASANIE